MTDWTNPSTSQTHNNELAATKGRDESCAKMDFSADSNIPDGTIRWSSANSRFEIWDATGLSWSALSSKYLINVDKLDGTDAGNASGNVPLNNGTKNTDLNADQVDGYHAGNASGNVPVSNGTRNANLNADLLDNKEGTYYDDTPNGTKVLFYQASVPTGYVQDVSTNDRMLRVVSGTGGGSGGNWSMSGLSIDGHALTIAEMPSHNHGGGNHSHFMYTGFGDNNNDNNEPPAGSNGNITNGTNQYTSSSGNVISTQGSDNAHTHGITNSSWRPSYLDVIIGTRSK